MVSSIKIKDSFYTEKALRLLNPKDYHDANPMKYPTIALTEEEEEDLAMLETIQDLLSDLSQKFVTVYEKNPYEDPDGGSEKAIYLPDHDAVGFKINVEKSGYYNIYLRYFSINEDGVSKKTSIERSIYIDGAIPFYESTYVSISKTYRSYVEDGEGNKLYGSNIQNGDDRGFATDINGNEIRPSAEMTGVENDRFDGFHRFSCGAVEVLFVGRRACSAVLRPQRADGAFGHPSGAGERGAVL